MGKNLGGLVIPGIALAIGLVFMLNGANNKPEGKASEKLGENCELTIGAPSKCSGTVKSIGLTDSGDSMRVDLLVDKATGRIRTLFLKIRDSSNIEVGRVVNLELTSRDGTSVDRAKLLDAGEPQSLWCTTAYWRTTQTEWTEFTGMGVTVNTITFPELGRPGTKGVILQNNVIKGVISWPAGYDCKPGVGTPYGG